MLLCGTCDKRRAKSVFPQKLDFTASLAADAQARVLEVDLTFTRASKLFVTGWSRLPVDGARRSPI